MTSPDLETEFDAAIARAGLTIAPDRRDAMLEAFRAWRDLRKELTAPMPLATEPAFALRQPAGPR